MGADGTVEYDAIIPAMLEESLPDIMVGVVIVLVLSASMSTLSSLVLTSSSTLTLDFLKLLIFKKMDDRKQLFVMRVLIVFFVLISVVLALDPPTFIAQLMGISWGALAGAWPPSCTGCSGSGRRRQPCGRPSSAALELQ